MESGYWLCNVTGVDKIGALILLAYSELYSLQQERGSKNAKILSAFCQVSQAAGRNKI